MSDKKEDFETASSSKPPSTSATTGSTWSRFKDPRVVRVSRALGGKDRHSKVCTVRGLRDRRVRLSVPTAIQLYDLQERLGLNQPSKVVDWLLNAAKHEIDELPPLQIPQGMFNFTNNYHHLQSNNNNNNSFNLDQPMMNFQEFGSAGSHDHQLLVDKQGLNNNALIPSSSSSYNSIFKLDSSNLTLAHPRAGQHEDWHGFGLMPFQPGLVYHHQPAGDEVNNINVQRSQLSTSPFSSTGQPDRQMHDFNLLQPSLQDHNEENENMK